MIQKAKGNKIYNGASTTDSIFVIGIGIEAGGFEWGIFLEKVRDGVDLDH